MGKEGGGGGKRRMATAMVEGEGFRCHHSCSWSWARVWVQGMMTSPEPELVATIEAGEEGDRDGFHVNGNVDTPVTL